MGGSFTGEFTGEHERYWATILCMGSWVMILLMLLLILLMLLMVLLLLLLLLLVGLPATEMPLLSSVS